MINVLFGCFIILKLSGLTFAATSWWVLAWYPVLIIIGVITVKSLERYIKGDNEK